MKTNFFVTIGLALATTGLMVSPVGAKTLYKKGTMEVLGAECKVLDNGDISWKRNSSDTNWHKIPKGSPDYWKYECRDGVFYGQSDLALSARMNHGDRAMTAATVSGTSAADNPSAARQTLTVRHTGAFKPR